MSLHHHLAAAAADSSLSSLPVLAAVFAGIVAVWAVVRGIFRLLRGMVALAIGFVAGTIVFLKAPGWLHGTVENPSGWLLGGLSMVAGAVGHLGSRAALGSLFGALDTAQAAGEGVSKGKAVLLSLLPSGFLMWAGGIVLRLTGAVSGIAHADGSHASGDQPWLAQARQALSSGVVGRLLNATDPVTSPAQVRLAEILIAMRDSARWPEVRRDPALKAVLTHPKVQRLMNDREVKKAVSFANYTGLLTLPELKEAAEDPTLKAALLALPAAPVRRALPAD